MQQDIKPAEPKKTVPAKVRIVMSQDEVTQLVFKIYMAIFLCSILFAVIGIAIVWVISFLAGLFGIRL